ncbi:MAG: holo-ACP synthase [Legionellales bacterium]|nr:holo-ACP synthase [Legionellales bacterium]
MIYGVGIDLVSINRIHKIYENFSTNFINKILTEIEKEDFKNIQNPGRFLAKKFAVKEAFVKALGKGFQRNIFPKDIGTHNDKLGKPILHYSNFIEEILNNESINIQHVSISDEKEFAIAIVTLEVS